MLVRLGMSGDSVRAAQQRLSDLHFLSGLVDGRFGGGTEAAVKSFQKSNGRAVTGVIDPATWAALFPGQPPPVSPLASVALIHRCLSLTGSFETNHQPPDCFSALTGDFDGQGISFGVLQWNLGQNTLQGLLKEAFGQYPEVCRGIFHDHFDTIESLAATSLEQQMEFCRSIQNRGVVQEPWQGMLIALGRTPEFQETQVAQVRDRYAAALRLCGEYGLKSERAAAFMFDIMTQNGGISAIVKNQILAGFAQIPAVTNDMEIAKMRIIAKCRAAVAKPAFINDVLSRKMTIAEGSGTVHGIFYDLEDTFAITMNPIA